MLVEPQAQEWAFRFGNPASQHRTPIIIKVQPFGTAVEHLRQLPLEVPER
jgi:hypothetical protein